MNRQQAKELLPIIQAFAEGKEIMYRNKGLNEGWMEMKELPELAFGDYDYCIKHREECWKEMQKHQPFWMNKM